MAQRKQVPLRLDPAVHDALAKWAADELRSVNGHIEILLRAALKQAGRLPSDAKPIRRRGRPPLGADLRESDEPDEPDAPDEPDESDELDALPAPEEPSEPDVPPAQPDPSEPGA